MPTGFLGHHIYYNNDLTKAYVTGFGHSALRVIDLTRVPWRMRTVAIPDCRALDHVIFSGDNARWWLTCVGSQSVIVGDGQTDEPVKVIHLPKPYPHGIALHEGIDRLLVANVHNPYTYLDSQQTVTVIEASTGTPLSTVRLAHGPGAEVQSPADVLFVPGADPPAAYVTNVDSNSLWLMTWDPGKADFNATQVFDFASIDSRLPILLYYNRAGDRLYVITMSPGRFHIFDIADDLRHPKLLKTVDCAEGAHHAAFSPDERYAFVQNGLLNVPGLSDGSITVIDLERQEAVASIDTFKELGLAHKHIIMLPDWYTPMGW